MSLVPTKTVYSVKKGDRGIVVWAVQRALNDYVSEADFPVVEDGIFGEQTHRRVLDFQNFVGIKGDGIFGSQTSPLMAKYLERRVSASLPPGLVRGVVYAESAGYIGAVNASSPGGIDCGYVQRRVYESDYGDEAVVRRAFDGLYQMNLLARSLRSRHDAFFGRPGARTHELAWRLAAMHHNYPYAAEKISREGTANLSSYWKTPASWVEAIGARFVDAAVVRTPLEWVRYYALGAPIHNHPGVTTQFVENWPK